MPLIRLLVLILCFVGYSHAVEVQGLYSAKLRVDSQLRKDRNQAQRGALAQVLIKVSGNSEVVKHPLISAQLNKATEFMIQYRFVNLNQQQFLEAKFDEIKVNELLSKAGYSIWGKRRPLLMTWVAIESDSGFERQLISDSLPYEEKDLLKIIASERGLPVAFPLLDLQELMSISVNDVWGRFYQTIQQAGERYFADVHLLVRIYKSDTENNGDDENFSETVVAVDAENNAAQKAITWQLDWVFVDNDQYVSGELTGEDKLTLIETTVNDVADILAQRYSIDHSGETTAHIVLDVVNINAIADYVAAENFLTSLSSVTDVTLLSVEGSEASFDLQLVGKVDDLLNTIALDHRLSKVFNPLMDDETESATHEYRWQP